MLIRFCPGQINIESQEKKWIKSDGENIYYGKVFACNENGSRLFTLMAITLVVLSILAFTSVIPGGIIAGSLLIGAAMAILTPIIIGTWRFYGAQKQPEQ